MIRSKKLKRFTNINHVFFNSIGGKSNGRASDDAITLFKSHGMGITDVAAAAYVYEQSKKLGLGVELPINA